MINVTSITSFVILFLFSEFQTGSGNIWLFYKVSELSDRCWRMANQVMDKIENGQIQPTRRKKNIAKSKLNVLQTSFRCLNGKDPIKNEPEIFQILVQYTNGDLAEEGESKPKRSRTFEDTSTSVSITSSNLCHVFVELDISETKPNWLPQIRMIAKIKCDFTLPVKEK